MVPGILIALVINEPTWNILRLMQNKQRNGRGKRLFKMGKVPKAAYGLVFWQSNLVDKLIRNGQCLKSQWVALARHGQGKQLFIGNGGLYRERIGLMMSYDVVRCFCLQEKSP